MEQELPTWVRDQGVSGIPVGFFHPPEGISGNLVQEILDLPAGSWLCQLRAQFRCPWGARCSQQGLSCGMLVLWPSPSFSSSCLLPGSSREPVPGRAPGILARSQRLQPQLGAAPSAPGVSGTSPIPPGSLLRDGGGSSSRDLSRLAGLNLGDVRRDGMSR